MFSLPDGGLHGHTCYGKRLPSQQLLSMSEITFPAGGTAPASGLSGVKYPAASYGACPGLFFLPQRAGYLTLAAFAKYPRKRGCLAHCSRE